MGTLSPLGLLLKKPQFQGKIFTSTFLQAAVAGPILGIDFLRKLKLTVSPEISQIQFACLAAALPAIFFAFSRPARPPNIFSGLVRLAFFLFSSTPVPALVPIPPPTATTCSQSPAVSAYLARNPEVKSSSFSSRE
jgi:hypothetical protein